MKYARALRTVSGEEWGMLGLALGVCLVILTLVLVVFWQSLLSNGWAHPSFRGFANYWTAFQKPWVEEAILHTVYVSIGTTACSTIIGVSLAWINGRTNVPCRSMLELLTIVPFFLSPFVGAIAWMHLAAPGVGLLNQFAHAVFGSSRDVFDIYGPAGIVWVQGIFFTPFVYLMTIGTLRRMDPSLEESSRACGRGVWGTTCRITLPLVMPAILSGVIIVFASSAAEFGVPLALGSPYGFETLSTEIFSVLQRTQPRYDLASTMGAILLAATLILIFLYQRIVRSRQFVTVSGKGFQARTVDLKAWRYAALAWNLLYALVAVILPLVVLAIISLQKVWLGTIDTAHLTAANYHFVLFANPETRSGIEHSLFLAIFGAFLAVALSFVVSRLVYRSRVPGRHLVDMIISVPLGVPAIVLGFGALIVFIRTPLYGTLSVLLLAYIVRFIPVGQRSVTGSLLALSPELEESSRACGAGWARTMGKVTLPLLKPGLAASWMLLFIIFLRELPISILLWTSGTEVMSVALYQTLDQGTAGQTAAYAIIQAGIILLVLLGFRWIIGKEAIIEA